MSSVSFSPGSANGGLAYPAFLFCCGVDAASGELRSSRDAARGTIVVGRVSAKLARNHVPRGATAKAVLLEKQRGLRLRSSGQRGPDFVLSKGRRDRNAPWLSWSDGEGGNYVAPPQASVCITSTSVHRFFVFFVLSSVERCERRVPTSTIYRGWEVFDISPHFCYTPGNFVAEDLYNIFLRALLNRVTCVVRKTRRLF